MALPSTSVTNVGQPLTIIGKDLDAGATFNSDVALGTGPLRAGQIMNYTPATQVLTPNLNGALPTAPIVLYGILADDFDDTGSTVALPAMVYKEGTFLRQELESANNYAIPPGSTIELNLRDNGIMLEQSYELYTGLSPIPAGVVPLGAEAEEGQPKEEGKEGQRKEEGKEGQRTEETKPGQ
jgi:hypothetical protein